MNEERWRRVTGEKRCFSQHSWTPLLPEYLLSYLVHLTTLVVGVLTEKEYFAPSYQMGSDRFEHRFSLISKVGFLSRSKGRESVGSGVEEGMKNIESIRGLVPQVGK